MTTISIATLGCKVNQFESEALMTSLEQRGYQRVAFEAGADITIINTCTVTHRADFQSRQMVRRAFRFNPKSLILVTGCYSQVDPQALTGIEGVNYVLGNQEKVKIPDLLPLIQKGDFQKVQVSDIQEERFFSDMSVPSFHNHTRAFLKIQDGCDARCSYCIVPLARGRSRSLLPERVMEHLKELKDKGYKEVVLTGIHIGSYGLDLTPSTPLEKLLKQMEEGETSDRIRLSSIEPLEFSPGLISFLKESKKVCPHLHIPIQSGDEEILKRMNRGYDRSLIFDLFHTLHQSIPELCLGADVIVGFPGETEEKFESTYGLIESLPLSYLHVFPFSRRKGTPASQFPEQVEEVRIKERAEKMRELGKQKRQTFYRQYLHQELRVLMEGRKEKEHGRWRGLSRNYIPVFFADEERFRGHPDWTNQECTVKVIEVKEKGVLGEVWRERMEEERLASLKELEERLGHRFNKIAWLDQALTHKSYIHEMNSSRNVSNEVLEFLGDAVLNLVVSHLLLQKFPEAQEGALSLRRAHLVNRNALALLSRELRLDGDLLLGKGELLSGGMKKSSILANAYEALIGAIYMDSGFNRALEVIRHHLKSYLQSETPFPLFNDYKSLLQEQIQRTHGLSPQYRVIKELGPDHDKQFQASVVIGGEVKGIGWGKSKKLAEQEAAKNALEGSNPEEYFSERLNQEGCQ